jgi:hypothetical protein
MPTFGCPLLFDVAADPFDGMLYDGSFNACAVQSQQPGFPPYYVLGRRLDPLLLSRGPDAGQTREVAITITAAGVSARFRDPLRVYDTQLGTECEMERVGDGEMSRCRPVSGSGLIFMPYSDSACTQPLPKLGDGRLAGTCGLGRDAPYLDAGQTLYRIGARHIGSVYTQFGSCDPAVDPIYDLVDPFAQSTLPTAVKRRDP